MAFKSADPWTSSGGRPSSLPIRAPICSSGAMTLAMGLADSDSSPVRTQLNDCPQSSPAIRRIAVPELPRSSACRGARNPRRPTPCTITSVEDRCSMCTPIAAIAASVARQSSPARNPLISVTPSAILPSIRARCETDLSPGTVMVAAVTLEGVTKKSMAAPVVPGVSR